MPLCAFWRCRAGSRALESDARPAERHRQAPHFRQGRADFSGRRSGEWHLRPRQRLAERLLPARVWRGLHGAPRRRRLLDRRTRAGVRQAPARVRARGRTHRDGASFRAGPHEIAARRPAPLAGTGTAGFPCRVGTGQTARRLPADASARRAPIRQCRTSVSSYGRMRVVDRAALAKLCADQSSQRQRRRP